MLLGLRPKPLHPGTIWFPCEDLVTVLLNITGEHLSGALARFLMTSAEGNVNQHVCIVRPEPITNLVPEVWLAHSCQHPMMQPEIQLEQSWGIPRGADASNLSVIFSIYRPNPSKSSPPLSKYSTRNCHCQHYRRHRPRPPPDRAPAGVPHPPHRRRGHRQAGRARGGGPVARLPDEPDDQGQLQEGGPLPDGMYEDLHAPGEFAEELAMPSNMP